MRNKAVKQGPTTMASKPDQAKPAELQIAQRRQHFEWKCVVGPVLRDDRRDVGFHEPTHLIQNLQFLSVQALGDLVKVAVRHWQWLCFLNVSSCCSHPGLLLIS